MTTQNFFKCLYTTRLFGLLILLVTTGLGCKKEKQSDTKKIYFTGISPKDQNGNTVAAPDSNDWNTSDVWADQEEALFSNKYTANCTPTTGYNIMAYPNPCRNVFYLDLRKNPSTRMELRLVDENFKVLFSSDSITENNLAVQAGALGIKGTVRLYYKFIENNCEFKGHGDVLIQ
jgi:hypothetical protein